MKTTAIFLFTVFMVLAAIKTYAQEVSTPKADPKYTSKTSTSGGSQVHSTSKLGGGLPDTHYKLEGVEGSNYIGYNWPAGKVVLTDGSVIESYFLRYDILVDQMQFISGSDTLAFAAPQELNSISFEGHTFVYEMYQCENTLHKGFFELIEPGKNRLLLKRLVTYQVPDPNIPMDKNATKYYIDECYFIAKPGQPASKLLCNRKSALSILNEHNEEIEDYLKVTGNKVKTPDDLKKLVAYYNSLDE